MSRLLITGFGPFPTVPDNPSGRLARRLAASPHLRRILGEAPDCLVLNTRYGALDTQLAPVLAKRPSAVLMIGVAARRPRVCVEIRAVNRVSRLFPDTEGRVSRTLAFEPDGPAQRPSPAALAVRIALKRAGLDAAASRDAGRYLCNASYYRVLEQGCPAVFLHIPMPPRTRRPKPGGGRRRPAPDRWAQAFTEAARVLALRGRARPSAAPQAHSR
ncbi:peptidase C15 pyroglutamyl peptidase I [Methylorubrum populi]|uniref:Pyrrolidone-carboxylate peptidase n=1 Tax=Methylorubrum populi TaxID=223967 RepID=A0A160PCQ9_9HYPH|nr:peptidase C15 [Methylorubrum populi]BAU88960.1 peptidase C15 pyroglutamyl peptidase I [Methylorubrum populi]